MNRRDKVEEGSVLWSPTAARQQRAKMTHFMHWLEQQKGLTFDGYSDLWAWSVEDLEGFWASMWAYFGVDAHAPWERVLEEEQMPGVRWFPGARLNYAAHALRRQDDHPAIIFQHEGSPLRTVSFRALADQVGRAAEGMRRMGVKEGDRVVAYVTNTPETVVAFLAAASIGAIWSSCSPEFGMQSVVDRFRQIEPTLLFAVAGYRYNGKTFDRTPVVQEIINNLPTLKGTVIMPGEDGEAVSSSITDAVGWDELVSQPAPLQFASLAFEHPLWILFSSGTTGLPKAIVQGHGGILLEHLKALALHLDLGPDDRFFWQTTTGWMMWNFLVSGLLLGATILLYDGSPAVDGMRALWRFAQDTEATYFGTSAPFIHACMKQRLTPGRTFRLERLRGLGSTGAPLSPEGFQWVYDEVHDDLVLGSLSGGTDVCTAFVLPCPLLEVRAGEIQCRGLGAKVEAFDESGRPIVDEVGELVVTRPLPSMPLYFWNDPDHARYKESYFDVYPGVWRHGDWVKVTSRGSCVIYGRSDSTLNRSGIRTGTSDVYRVVEAVEGVVEALVVDTGGFGREGKLILFVVVEPGRTLDEAMQRTIGERLRGELSPRHVPDAIVPIASVPKTLNGKKLEVPIRRILLGASVAEVVTPGAVANPEALEFFVAFAKEAGVADPP